MNNEHDTEGIIMTSIVPSSSPAPMSAPAPMPQTAASPALRFGKKQEEDSFVSQREEISPADRIKGSLTGAIKAIFQPKSLALDALIAVAITVATAWLPGSQLLTIPAFFAISATLRAIKGGIQGYQNPGGIQPQQSGGLLMFPVSSN